MKSVEAALVGGVDRATVGVWLEGIESAELSDVMRARPEDVEGLGSVQQSEVSTWESLSVVAVGRDGERIQDWKGIQENCRGEVRPFEQEWRRRDV